jgi:uncharacterized protein (TIGR00297 family)
VNLLAQYVVGMVLSGLVALVAFRRGSLSRSGVLGAMLVGTAVWGSGGWVWGVLLITFFVLSSLLSHFKSAAKQRVADNFAKGHRRDLGQALANGGVGALLAVGSLLYPQPVMLAAFVGAMAAVNADTWATEIGVLSKRRPRLVTTWRSVDPGTSGGVSALGTAATLAGALTIALVAVALLAVDNLLGGGWSIRIAKAGPAAVFALIPVGLLAGGIGSLFDSLLGATVQVIYYSPRRQKETEKSIDSDGTVNVLLRGWHWLGTDQVNLLSSLVGAGIAALTWSLFT